MEKIRLDKYLADMGIGTRAEVKKMIRAKKVSVNGETVTSPELKIDTKADEVGQTEKICRMPEPSIIC